MTNKAKMIQGVDDTLWKRFKVHCVIKDLAMGQMFNKILEDYLEKEEKRE